jgi:choline dehydrogenase-like flavoprotein
VTVPHTPLRTIFSASARETLRAAVDRIVPDAPADLAARVEDRIATLAPHKVAEVRQALAVFGSRGAALFSLGGRACTAGIPRPFARLGAAERDAMLDAWSTSPLPQARTVYQLLRRLTLVTHYADHRTHAQIGYRGSLHARLPAVPWEGPAGPDATSETDGPSPIVRAAAWTAPTPAREIPRGVFCAATMPASPETRADVIVIGTGAGGAVAAARFAEAGKRVILLEAGEFVRSDEFTEDEGTLTARLYADGGLRATDDLAVSMLQGATVGGGTTINWMIMLRTPPHVLHEWSTRFGLEGMTATDLAPVFDRVEREVHTARVPDDAHSANNRILLNGAAALGWHVTPGRINARGCVRAGFCGQGCRYDAKQGTQQTFVPRALAHDAVLYTNARVTRIEVGGLSGGAARGLRSKRVQAVIAARDGRTAPREVTFEAPIVVVSAGAVETPALLQRSGLGSGAVGSYLRLHPTTAVIGIHRDEVYGAAGIPLSATCDEFLQRDARGYGFWLQCPPLHPSLGAAALPGFGASHAALMRQFPYLASTIALVRDGSDLDHSSGAVRVNRRGETRISYALSAADQDTMRAAMDAAARLQFAAGAREVRTLHTQPLVLTREADIAAIRSRPVHANHLGVFSAHVNGTCRMGTDARTSGTTPDGEVHGARGVYVFDGSLLPTGVGVNPQETIMAITTVLAERLLVRWPG